MGIIGIRAHRACREYRGYRACRVYRVERVLRGFPGFRVALNPKPFSLNPRVYPEKPGEAFADPRPSRGRMCPTKEATPHEGTPTLNPKP